MYPPEQLTEPIFIPTDNCKAPQGSSGLFKGIMPQELPLGQNDYPSELISSSSLFFKGGGATYSTRRLDLSSADSHFSRERIYQGPSLEPEPAIRTNQPDPPSRVIPKELNSVVQPSMTKTQSCTVDEYSTITFLPEPVPSSIDPSVEFTDSRVTRESGYPDRQIDFPSKTYPAPPLLAREQSSGSSVTRKIPLELSSAPDYSITRGLMDQNPDPSTRFVVASRKIPSELFSIEKSVGDTAAGSSLSTGIPFHSVSKLFSSYLTEAKQLLMAAE